MKEKMTMVRIDIKGHIGKVFSFFGDVECTTSDEIKQALTEANGEPLEVHINSEGGNVFEGMAMYNIIKQYKGEKVAYVDALCASASTLPMIACDKIIASEASNFVFHKARTDVHGNVKDLEKVIQDLNAIDSVIVSLYAKRFKGSEEELEALLDADKIITPTEALKHGLVDVVGEEVAEDEPEAVDLNSHKTDTQLVSEQTFNALKEALSKFK